MEIFIIALLAAVVGGYIVKKNNLSPTSSTPTGGQATSAPVPPHLQAGAILLTDQQITDSEIAIIGNHFTYPIADKRNFNKLCLQELSKERLLVTDISPGTHCQSGGTYQGPLLAITVGKTGELALGAVGGIGAAAGGTFGSAAGLFGTGFAASGTALGTAIPVAGVAIGIGLAIYGAISAHHQAAVRNEQGLECQLAPPADYSLQVIETAVMNKTITIQQAQTALNTLYTDFVNSAKNGQAGQLEDRPGKLNAMGWYAHLLHAIIIKKQNRYASLVS